MKNIAKKSVVNMIVLMILLATSLGGCGRSPNPVQVWQPTDDNLSCSSLIAAMDEADASIRKLLPKSEKTGKNVALGVAGAFLLVPWFFMDFSDAEKMEIDALRNRYNHLSRIYRDKGCHNKAGGRDVKEIPDLFKQPKEAKDAA